MTKKPLKQLTQKAWNDPVVSGLVVIAIAGPVGSYFLGWWSVFAEWLASTAAFLIAATPVPNWLLLILGLTTSALLGFLALAAWTRLRPSRKTHTYTEDTFLNMRWRWQYYGNTIMSITPYCPHCDLQIQPRRTPKLDMMSMRGIGNTHQTQYFCDGCGAQIHTTDTRHDGTIDFVERQIRRNLRARQPSP